MADGEEDALGFGGAEGPSKCLVVVTFSDTIPRSLLSALGRGRLGSWERGNKFSWESVLVDEHSRSFLTLNSTEEEEDVGGFGGADEGDDEEDGFGDDFDEEAEAEGFGDADEEEEIDEDGAGWGNADDEEGTADMAPEPEHSKDGAMDLFEAFAGSYFNKGADPKYTIEPMTTPLLKLRGGKEQNAIEMFKLVCQFMGITAVVGKGSLGAVAAVQAIARFGIQEEHLREELYCQMLKQMNGNPAAASRARGTILFTLIIGTFPCSAKLLPIVDAFIREGPKGYMSYCNLILRRCIHNGPRMQPPCSLEFEAVKRKQIMRVRVITDLVTREAVTARLDSASVMSEWVQEIGAKLGMKDTYGWSIYVDRFDRLESLRGAGIKGLHVMDVISKIDQKNKQDGKAAYLDISGQLSFRKELFAADHDSMKDPVATHLAFNQIRQGIKEGIYVCASEEYDNILAIVFYADFGDAVDETKVIKFLEFWLPEDAKKQKSPKERASNVEKIHAKSEYSRKKFSRPQSQDLVLKFALEKWGKVNSFSSDGSIMLFANGQKKVPRASTRRKSSDGSTRRKSK